MKTIRTNCFETNSSSTHSFTIVSKSKLKNKQKEILPLFDENTNTLHIDRLCDQPCFAKIETYSEDTWVLKATTVHEKAALFLHHVEGRYDSSLDFEKVREIVRSTAGYSAVVGKPDSGLNSYSEDGVDYLYAIEEAEDPYAAVVKFIRDVIFNDDLVMQESESGY